MKPVLLDRNEFRESVFARDSHRCVFCAEPAVDAHHIIERRLWPDGGYYLENGASVCARHHLLCEQTVISVETVREAAGIHGVLVPPHLYSDARIDKWGNPILSDGRRLPGELFSDPSVQKIFAEGGVLDSFVHWVKYPRTHHLPWSAGIHDDDRVLPSLAGFFGKRVIVTEKMDGENTTLYRDYMHARSVDGRNHPSRNWVKGLWAKLRDDIPQGWRVCGENLYAQHSIPYSDLPSYFLGFSILDERNHCLSWDETKEWFTLLDIARVPVLYDGIFDEPVIRGLWDDKKWDGSEGYVVRVADAFSYGDFRKNIGKFVRRGHVQTAKHWMHGQRVIPNGLMHVQAGGKPPWRIGKP